MKLQNSSLCYRTSGKSVLFVGPWPPPFGGIASHLYELLPGISSKGYKVTSIFYSDDISESVSFDRGVKNISFSPKYFFFKNILRILFVSLSSASKRKGLSIRRFLRAVSTAERINQIIKEEGISCVFTYDTEQLYFIPFVAGGLNKPKIFSTIYALFYLTPEAYISEKNFLRFAISKTDLILSCSKYCVDSGKRFLGIDYPSGVIYNNVDELLYHPDNDGGEIRRKYNIPKNSIVLMTMGRIGVDMGADFLLSACNRITALNENIILFFVGAKSELCDEVKKLSQINDCVRFAFDIPFSDKHLYFAACDIFTAPTKEKHACMGIANIEAMMSGKAVISSTSGGHVETIEDNVCGFLVPFCNSKLDIEYYLSKLSILVNDSLLRSQFGQNGRSRALKLFTNERIVSQHLELIEGR
jgi:glycosyltransferase involved in cell wall biosynthesis